jgi:hypothetical protein
MAIASKVLTGPVEEGMSISSLQALSLKGVVLMFVCMSTQKTTYLIKSLFSRHEQSSQIVSSDWNIYYKLRQAQPP